MWLRPIRESTANDLCKFILTYSYNPILSYVQYRDFGEVCVTPGWLSCVSWAFTPSWLIFQLSGWSSLILDLWDLIGVGPCRRATGSPCWVFFQNLFEYFGSVKPMGGMVYPIMTSWLHLCHHLVEEVLWTLAIVGSYRKLYTSLKQNLGDQPLGVHCHMSSFKIIQLCPPQNWVENCTVPFILS